MLDRFRTNVSTVISNYGKPNPSKNETVSNNYDSQILSRHTT